MSASAAPISPSVPSQKRARAAEESASEQKRPRSESGVPSWPVVQCIGKEGWTITQKGSLQQWVAAANSERPDPFTHSNAGQIARYLTMDATLKTLERQQELKEQREVRKAKPSTARSRIEKTLKRWAVAGRKPRESNSAPRIKQQSAVAKDDTQLFDLRPAELL